MLPGVHVAIAGIDGRVIRHATAEELGLLLCESHRVHHEKSTLATFGQRSAERGEKGKRMLVKDEITLGIGSLNTVDHASNHNNRISYSIETKLQITISISSL